MDEKKIAELLKSIIEEIKTIYQDYLTTDEFKAFEKRVEELSESFQKGDITEEVRDAEIEKVEAELTEILNTKFKEIDSLKNLSTYDVKNIFQTFSPNFFVDNDFKLPPKSFEDVDYINAMIPLLFQKIENEPSSFFNDLMSKNDFIDAFSNINYGYFIDFIKKCDNEEAITYFFTHYLKNKNTAMDYYELSRILSSFISSEKVSPEFVDWTIFESDNSPFMLQSAIMAIRNSTIDNKRKKDMLLNDSLLKYISEQNKDNQSTDYYYIFTGLASSCESFEDCLKMIDLVGDNEKFSLPNFIAKTRLPKDDLIKLIFHEKVFDKIKGSIGHIIEFSNMDYETIKDIVFDERVISQKDLDIFGVLSNKKLTADQLEEIISDDRLVFNDVSFFRFSNFFHEVLGSSIYPLNKKMVFINSPKVRPLLNNDCIISVLCNPLLSIEEANEIFLDKNYFYKMIGEYHEEYNNDPNANKGPFKYDKYEYVKSLMKINPYVVRSLSYSLLDDQILDMGQEFIDKISRDYYIGNMFAKQMKNKYISPYLSNMVESIINSRYKDDINIREYIPRLIESFAGSGFPMPGARYISKEKTIRTIMDKRCLDLSSLSSGNWRTLTEIALRDSSAYTVKYNNFIVMSSKDKADWSLNILPDVNSKEDLDNYENRRLDMCNQFFKEAVNNRDLDAAKNAFFNKYFSINIEEAIEIGRLYASAPSEFGNDPKYRMQVKYVELLNRILNINKIDELVKSFNYPIIPITFDENIHIDRMIKDMYSKQISDSVYKVYGDKKTIRIGDKEVAVYEPEDNFMMLVHSTDAYGKLEMINDNYDDSWNKGARTTNHGICCSLIANDNMGMAAVKDVLFGFDGWDPKAISLMAPYDICSKNDSYELEESRELLFLSARNIINYTRHSHNEIVLEREELRKDRRSRDKCNIQPSYVIIYSDMADEIKEKAIKCSEQMHIPIVYLDKEKIAQRECTKIDSKIEQLKSSQKLEDKIELLKDIILMHENNRSGCRINNPEYLEKYFPTDKISNVIKLVIAEMKIAYEDSKDIEAYYNQSSRLMDILEEENQKYITLTEASERKNEIDLEIDVYENTLIDFINPEITKYTTPKLEAIMEKELANDDSLSQTIRGMNKENLSNKIDYIVEKKLYNEDSKSHNIGHIERVLFLSTMIGNKELVNEDGLIDGHAIDLLERSALYHDCGRESDVKDANHGIRGSVIAEKQLKDEGYSVTDIAMVKSIIEYHEYADDEVRFKRICTNNGLPQEMIEYAKKIANCLKDADALDRTRFLSQTGRLNTDYLRTKTAKESVKIAEKLNDRYRKINRRMFEDICKNNAIKKIESTDNVKEGVDQDAKYY